MVRLFGSFLVRWWQVDDLQRIELEHIQSGRRGLVSSLAEAMAWITACTDELQPPPAVGGADQGLALNVDQEGGAPQKIDP
jgi:isochorismate synthase EntC